MQVNHAIKLKRSADRPDLAQLLGAALTKRPDLEATTLDGPVGRLGLPIWTSVIFSAQHGQYEELIASVEHALDEGGIAKRFEEWP